MASITPSPQLKQSSLQAGPKAQESNTLKGGGNPAPCPCSHTLDPFEFQDPEPWLSQGNQLLGWEWEKREKDPQGPLGVGVYDLPPPFPPSALSPLPRCLQSASSGFM